MATHSDSTPLPQPFTPDELTVLGLFYAGVRARALRAQYGIDPWPAIQRHRHLASEEFVRVAELAERAAARARAAAAAGRFA